VAAVPPVCTHQDYVTPAPLATCCNCAPPRRHTRLGEMRCPQSAPPKPWSTLPPAGHAPPPANLASCSGCSLTITLIAAPPAQPAHALPAQHSAGSPKPANGPRAPLPAQQTPAAPPAREPKPVDAASAPTYAQHQRVSERPQRTSKIHDCRWRRAGKMPVQHRATRRPSG
jgi:hypothetical protein